MLELDGTLRALTYGYHDYDGAYAYDDAEHGEGSTDFIRRKSGEGFVKYVFGSHWNIKYEIANSKK